MANKKVQIDIEAKDSASKTLKQFSEATKASFEQLKKSIDGLSNNIGKMVGMMQNFRREVDAANSSMARLSSTAAGVKTGGIPAGYIQSTGGLIIPAALAGYAGAAVGAGASKTTDTRAAIAKYIDSMPDNKPEDMMSVYKKAVSGITEAKKETEELNKSVKKVKDSTEKTTSSMLNNFRKVAASITALYVIINMVQKIAQAIEFGEKLSNQAAAFNRFTKSMGADSEKIVADLKDISQGTVDTATIMEKAGTAMLMGIPADKIAKLMEIARATSKVTGQSVGEAFADISLAVGRQSKMILDNLGIIIKLDAAYDSYAKKLGLTADQLTESEKRQAFLNATLEAGEKKAKAIGDTTSDIEGFTKVVTALKEVFAELAVLLATKLNPFFEDWAYILGIWTKSLKDSGKFEALVSTPVNITKMRDVDKLDEFIASLKEEMNITETLSDRYNELSRALATAQIHRERLTRVAREKYAPGKGGRFDVWGTESSKEELPADVLKRQKENLNQLEAQAGRASAISLAEQRKADIAELEMKKKTMVEAERWYEKKAQVEEHWDRIIAAKHREYDEKDKDALVEFEASILKIKGDAFGAEEVEENRRYEKLLELNKGNKKALELLEKEHVAKINQITAKKYEQEFDRREAIEKSTWEYLKDQQAQIDAADAWYRKHNETLADLDIEYTRAFKGETTAKILEIDKWKAAHIQALKEVGEATKENIAKITEMAEKQKAELDPLFVGLKEVGASIEDNITDNLIDGILAAKSWQEALSNALSAIASDLMRVALKMMLINALGEQGVGGGWLPKLFGIGTTVAAGYGGWGGADYLAGANGGIFPGGFQAFAGGGVVRKPTLGLVGEGRYNEAVVPLPDGKSIPVSMKGGGNNINTTINVTMGNQSAGNQAADKSTANQIAKAIEEEFNKNLAKQMRPGGLLNRREAGVY